MGEQENRRTGEKLKWKWKAGLEQSQGLSDNACGGIKRRRWGWNGRTGEKLKMETKKVERQVVIIKKDIEICEIRKR